MAIYAERGELEEFPILQSPLLANLEPHLRDLGDYFSSELQQGEASQHLLDKYGHRKTLRTVLNAPSRLESVSLELVSTGAALARSHSESDPAEYISGIIWSVLKDAPAPVGSEATAAITEQAISLANECSTYADLAAEAQRHVTEEVRDSATQYELVKLLSLDPTSIDNPEDRSILMALQSATNFERFKKGDEDSLFGQVESALGEGQLDQFLAQDFLRASLEAEPIDRQEEFRQKELKKLVALIKLSGQVEEGQAIELLSQPEYQGQWPDGSMRILGEYKAQILAGLKTNAENYTNNLIEAGQGINDPTEAEFMGSLRKWFLAFKMASGRAMTPREKIEVAQSKRQRRRQIAKAAGNVGVVEAVELAPQPKTLATVDLEGELVLEEGDKPLSELVEDYLKSHQGQPGLREDVARILDYLRNIDLSAGIPRGLKKYVQPVRRGGKELDLFALKPKYAVGLPTSSRDAKKIRVLFTRVGDAIGLFGIVDRDSVTKFERSLGITNGAE